jgi:hypothetical protein
MDFRRFLIERRAPFENQVDCITGTAKDTDFAHYASGRIKAEPFRFLIYGNRIGGTSQSASAAKRTLVIVKGNLASGIIERLPHLNRIEPRCRTTEQILQDGG